MQESFQESFIADTAILSQFQAVGRGLFQRGLISSHSGNLSMLLEDKLLITRRGCMLGDIRDLDLVETRLDRSDRISPLASSELQVHRTIYQNTKSRALVHAHPPHAIALSLTEKVVTPRDGEGMGLVPSVPVLGGAGITPRDIADPIAEALRDYPIVLVYGYGCFAASQLLEETLLWITAMEESCHILFLLKSLGNH
ncbi:MAG: class II aldolase/adducin family protein [Dehalococcoidia bacterium]|nr:class II aldolase/adducin family protein [Dehalococcoidia bacterium]MDP7239994.1 class II aldolase/adducin family protein [Dehalococcoidia bacterium]MDP7470141.1 class II aldolase/adducin family protein [Dehalococcoidia bacterium]